MSVIELDRQTVVCKRDAVGQIGGRGWFGVRVEEFSLIAQPCDIQPLIM